jgi:hypothetical protein
VFHRFVFLLTLCITLHADPATLQIRIVEGDGAVYALGSRATRGITVEVTNETGKPMDGVSVTFQLPEEGASGTFPNASKSKMATSGSDGRASVWGMQWNRTAGSIEVRITATKGDARAGTVCSLSLAAGKEASVRHGRGGHKWLWIALAVAGGAGGAVAAGGRVGTASPGTNAVTTTSIGAPTIAIGPQK